MNSSHLIIYIMLVIAKAIHHWQYVFPFTVDCRFIHESEEAMAIGMAFGNHYLHPFSRLTAASLNDIHRLACCLSLLHLFHFQRENIHKGESLEIVAEHEAHTEEGVALDVGEHVALPFAVCACIKRVPEVIFANCHLPVGQCQCLLHIARI